MNTIQSNWKEFEENVLSPDSPDIQRQEMKKSFYAGASSVIFIMAKIGAENVSEDAGAEILQGLIEECHLFAEGLIQ